MEHKSSQMGADVLPVSQRFGVRLKEERERTRLSQSDFGALGGVGRVAQANYESGERVPSIEYIYRLKDAGVNVDYLLWEGKKFNESPPDVLNVSLLDSCLIAVSMELAKTNNEADFSNLARLATLVYIRAVLRQPHEQMAFVKDMAAIAVGMWLEGKYR